MNVLQHLFPENDSPCLLFPGRALTYSGVKALADGFARSMGPEKRLVAIEAVAGVEFVATYLAGLAGGHAMALLPPGDGEAAGIFERDFSPSFSFAMRNGQWQMTEHGEGPHLDPNLAVMLATSGSEGRPRWVRLSAENIAANAASIARYLHLTPADRVAHTLPFHYSYGLSVLNSHLAAGGSMAFCGESVIAEDFLRHARALGCTGLSGVPYTFELLERIGIRDRLWPELRYMTSAGGRLPPELASRYGEAMAVHGGAFFLMYGQTEATARMAYVPPALLPEHPDCIGIAIPGGELRIADAQGRTITTAGVAGELFYRGPNVMMGYAAERADLAHGRGADELATGDIAHLTADGLFRLEGRARRFSKLAGLRIGHEQVEWALREAGFSAAVTGTDEALTLHLENASAEEAAMAIAMKASRLPARFLRIHRHELLPRLASGKIDHAALARQSIAPQAREAESLLADFAAAFYPKPVAPADSFDGLEGDSLAYVQVSLAIETRLGHLPEGWEAMPLSRLQALAGANKNPPPTMFSRIESHIVLRAAAILLIVVHHATLWPLPGGAAALMMMVGYGFARFHREALFEGRTAAFLLPMLRNLLPYFVIVAGFALAWEQVPWASVLLIGNLGFADPVQKTMLPFQFWFVEAYAQLCLLTAAVFAIPSVRRAAKGNPFVAGMGVLLFAFALRYAVPLVYDIGGRKMFLLTYVLWLPAMGWCACFAERLRQKLALLLAAAVLCPLAAYTGGNWSGAWVLYMLQFSVVVVLLFVPHVRLPRHAVPAVMLVSAASYHIYLFHRIVPEVLGLDAMGLSGIMASIALGLLCGIGAAALQRLVFARLGRRASLASSSA